MNKFALYNCTTYTCRSNSQSLLSARNFTTSASPISAKGVFDENL